MRALLVCLWDRCHDPEHHGLLSNLAVKKETDDPVSLTKIGGGPTLGERTDRDCPRQIVRGDGGIMPAKNTDLCPPDFEGVDLIFDHTHEPDETVESPLKGLSVLIDQHFIL